MQSQQQQRRAFRADQPNAGQTQQQRREAPNTMTKLGRPSGQQPAALIYQPQLQQTLSHNMPNRRHQTPLGSKDLIIRMLAEVFQVKQDESGQMRWHQVSTSLVPISLYSRTTSKWLDYLLTVPLSMQANDPANTMSPDSRDFLLLLQQFHQQTRVGGQQQQQLMTTTALEMETPIVFQVVGHDFIEGQFRKILNVKIRQPGTRLGQASDYFVYWRDQTTGKQFNQLSHQQFSASSYASNASFMHQQQHQQSAAAAQMKQANQTQMLNPMNVNQRQQQQHFDRYPQQNQTWGLNFASMNDAKLFFDICSLNIVNLDFNSEYLKQLSVNDGRFRQLARLSPSSLMLSQQRRSQQQQKTARAVAAQQQQRLARGKLARPKLRQDHQLEPQRQQQTLSRQVASSSRCSACREPYAMHQVATTPVNANELDELAISSRPCPVHGQTSGGKLRARSRSTTRQPLSSIGDSEDRTNLRARSFSTPASPEPNDQFHGATQRRRYRTNTEMDSRDQSQTLEWQKRQFKCQAAEGGGPSVRPEKPARGLLRPAHLLGSQESCNGSAKRQQQAVNSDRLLHSKPNTKTRYMGYLHNAQQQRQRRSSGGGAQLAQATDQTVSNMQDRSLFRSMAQNELESSFETHRDARVARAQYAKSRNMKEFLSLDAGGQQQLGQFGAQFDQHQRLQQQFRRPVVRQLTDNSNGGGKNNGRSHQKAQKDCLPLVKSTSKSFNTQQQSIVKDTPKARPLTAAGDNGANVCANSNGAANSMAQCNAATTTEDLPMDSSTRKRMFKLTSDEVISERTEPASLSVWAQASDEQQQHQRTEEGGCELASQRAVSLGPSDENNKFRGRRARSDVGRRRSLERSGCVDFDSMSSFVKQTPRLSPLPQSVAASPQQVLSDDIRLNENSIGLTDKTYGATGNGCHQETHQAADRTSSAAQHHSDRLTPSDHLNRSRTTTKLVDGQFVTAATLAANDNALKARQMFSSEHFHQQLAAFKSAPDISQLVEDSPGTREANWPSDYGECDYDSGGGIFERRTECSDVEVVMSEQQHWRCQQQHHFDPLPPLGSNLMRAGGHSLGRPNVSSYAVPLCATVKRPPQQQQQQHHQQAFARRQCHSCPNSLRRKRPLPSLDNTSELLHRHHRLELESQFDNCCSCQHCQRERSAIFVPLNELVVRPNTTTTLCTCCEPPDCVATNCHAHRLANRHEHQCLANQTLQCSHHHHQRQASHHHHHHLLDQHDHNNFRRSGSSSRPASSQSVRSPVQYGLYESDCDEEEEGEGDRGDEDLSSPIVCRSQRQQQRSNASDVVKPVQGYDQTMLRPSAKSRQRSKSQPPGGADQAEEPPSERSAQHLTKSMENVEKLIKEVQNELRQLKRQPLGAAQIDLKSSAMELLEEAADEVNQPENSTKASNGGHQKRQSSAKMSREEKETGSKRALSYSSATRRAGQFKCVGAIRKAGFLSVKKWILKRRQSIELARKQGWKRYWVCLRGTALLFHAVIETTKQQPADQQQQDGQQQKQIDLATWIRLNCSSQLQSVASLLQLEQQQQGNGQSETTMEALLESMSQCYIEEEPRHLIIIDGSIAQPIPEHPRRDFVFCLSTTFGDAYLFQASCQLESDNWLSAIHNACAASIARDLVRDEAVKLFETKIRHFELEAEKKLFLRHRLESRLTSMSSIMNNSTSGRLQTTDRQEGGSRKSTMRSLLYQLSQQLLALDTYIEQLQCEIYQLRCYLSSCSAQNLFYNNQTGQVAATSAPPTTSHQNRHDLPHPKSLLMHVSKPTKLLLIKLGVFTVSSFHAFIHARQESAKSIFETIEQQQQLSSTSRAAESPLFELRIRSQSISETLQNVAKGPNNIQLANETESLIELADLKTLSIVLTRTLFNKIKRAGESNDDDNEGGNQLEFAETSDDRYSIQDCGNQSVRLNVRLKANSNSSSIIKQVLKIIRPDVNEMDFLNYYLRLVAISPANATETADQTRTGQLEEYFVVKRHETPEDWSNFVHLELLEKIVFRVELSRGQMDEDETSAPFGISVEGQLLQGQCESQLNVYCSYIEWGSSADKAGLQDEDELLMVNGIAVADLDLMFVECIIQEASRLRAIVRSNRCKCPARSKQLDQTNWRSLDDDDENGDADGQRELDETGNKQNLNLLASNQTDGRQMNRSFNSQIISDEYLTSLVCPPPPAKSSAFFRETNLLRRKSDSNLNQTSANDDEDDDDEDRDRDRDRVGKNQLNVTTPMTMAKAISQHQIDSMEEPNEVNRKAQIEMMQPTSGLALRSSAELARQLMQNTERITRLLEKEPEPLVAAPTTSCEMSSPVAELIQTKSAQQNQIERVKKSILELIETEYAYIRHLETINEHYLAPLCETSFLNLFDLNSFSQIVLALLRFQNEFFSMLTKGIFDSISCCPMMDNLTNKALVVPPGDDFERFNWIVQQMDLFESVAKFKPILSSITQVFLDEVEKFKIYAPYCVAYSKFQRILHPKNANQASTFQNSATITSIPSTLNTFANSSTNSMNSLNQINSNQQNHRDLKLFNLIGSNGAAAAAADERQNQLKQLTEFLNNLDSSSSSASLSLQQSQRQDSKASSLIVSTNLDNSNSMLNYQKSLHHHQNFESYLIKPIQRIVKYPMLLNSIALAFDSKQTTGDDGGGGAETQDSSSEQLQAAIKQLESVINHVNESQRVHDEYGQLFEHIERQFFELQALDANKNLTSNLFGPHQPPITLNIGQLLYSGPVDWLNLSEFTRSKLNSKKLATIQLSSVLFVFESCVVFVCKEQHLGKPTSGKRLKLLSKTNETSAEQAQQSSGMTSRVFQWSTGSLASNGNGRDGSDAHEVVRYHTLIPVSEVQVRSVSASSAQDDGEDSSKQFKWELFQCSSSNSNSSLLTSKSSKQMKTQQQQQPKQHQQRRNSNAGKVYLLSSCSNEQRSAFLRKIRFIIRESVRNMSLPPLTSNKSSLSNKSTTTLANQKKLSTSSASSNTSNTNVNTSMSLSPAESSDRPDCVTRDQSTAITFEPYTKQVHEVKT